MCHTVALKCAWLYFIIFYLILIIHYSDYSPKENIPMAVCPVVFPHPWIFPNKQTTNVGYLCISADKILIQFLNIWFLQVYVGTTTWSCLMTWKLLRGSWREQQQLLVTPGKLTSCAKTERKDLKTPVPSVLKMVKSTGWFFYCSSILVLFVYFLRLILRF